MCERRASTDANRVVIAVWKSMLVANADMGLSDSSDGARSVCHSRMRAASFSRS